MAIPSRQIGWSTESNLLWTISKELERLTCVTAGECDTTTTTTTSSTWTFVSNEISVFPANSNGYTLYTGEWTNYDDGQTVDTFPLAGDFFTDNISSNTSYLSTNGYMILNPTEYNIYGNSGDLYLTPGNPLDDGDIQNFWYLSNGNAAKWKTSMLVYCGHYENETVPYSYILNIYRDNLYQYIETCCKTNADNDAGPDSNLLQASTATQVWQSPLDGTTWTYLGFGSIV